jgi:hypothetical protein
MKTLLNLLCVVAVAAFVSGCGDGHDHSAHDHGGHHHDAPHGGMLVELGEHEYNVEFVHDAAAGTLTAYVLDGHAESFVKIASGSWMVEVKAGGMTDSLSFAPQANAATGEIIGNTSQFTAQAEWLKTSPAFEGTIAELDVRGKKYAGVKFKFPN